MLNHYPGPAVIYQDEEVGVLCPLPDPKEVCTLMSTKEGLDHPGKLTSTPAPKMIEKAINQLVPVGELPPGIREKLHTLLHEFSDVLSTGDAELGHITLIQHKINTGDAAPICQPPRRLPHHQREQVHKLVKDMLGREVIKPAYGPWSSPFVLVKKKDGSKRFCVDFRKVNTQRKKDCHPLPRIDNTLDRLGQAKWFSTLDLMPGYW